jgi:PhoH-like ATPase
MAKKIVVLDTSVFINNPTAYESFKGQSIFIPIAVLEELDKLKKHSDSVGRNARVSIKKLDELSMSGEIHKGIKIGDDTLIVIDANDYVGLGADAKYGDGKILACAMKLKETAGKVPVVLVSRDINLRVKARALGLEAEGYDKEETDDTEIYKGYRSVEDADAGEVLNEAGMISVADYELDAMLPNEYVFFTGKKGKGVATGRRVGKQIRLVKEQVPWGLKSRNKEQFCAIDLLMDPSVPLVSLVGRAGGGKTLVSLAASLELVLNKKQYETLMIFRPVSVIGAELGFLPGDLAAKVMPLFEAVSDAFSVLFSDKSKKGDGWKKQLFQYTDNGTIQQNPISYLRGRSIPKAFILVDEAQNITKDEIKTILTRAGEGTKIVLTGDPSQIDLRNLDSTNNGLSHVIDKFRNSELAGSVLFEKGERSQLATLAADIL